MKTTNEEILKYLSGMMNESEMSMFEEKLKTSEELKIQMKNVKETLFGLDAESAGLNEIYFNNLIPHVRLRMENKRKFLVLRKLYYLAPALTIVLLLVLFYPRGHSTTQYNYQDLAEVVVNNIDDQDVADKYVSDNLFYSSYGSALDNSDFTVGLENTNDGIPDSYMKLLDYSSTDTYSILNNLTDNDLESLYKELNNIKFQ